jgi:hypothetical protein
MEQTRAWWFLLAFTLIGVLTVIEGINDGFTVWDWLVLVVSIVFALQALWTLTRGRSSPS